MGLLVPPSRMSLRTFCFFPSIKRRLDMFVQESIASMGPENLTIESRGGAMLTACSARAVTVNPALASRSVLS